MSAPGCRCVSRTSDRSAAVRRSRRIRVAGKFMPFSVVGSIPRLKIETWGTRYDRRVSLLPEIPLPLGESAAVALEWPRLRDHIASLAASPLGRTWTLALEPCADARWIDAQQQ